MQSEPVHIDLEAHRAPHNLQRLFKRPDALSDPLYVVTVIFNSPRFRTRWKHFQDFSKHVAESGAILYTVECAFGDRDFAVTEAGNPRHIQVRTFHELWLKENLINIGVSRLPSDWTKVAWIDADFLFARHDWADETRHMLEHHPLVQLFSHIMWLDDQHRPMGTGESFAHLHRYGKIPVQKGRNYPGIGAPGGAWAARREAWDAMGGLIDFCVLGAADWHMAHALISNVDRMLKADYHKRYKDLILQWKHRVENSYWMERPIAGNIGVVSGTVTHYWHGPMTSRRYNSREDILIRHQFNPDYDLKKDWAGVNQLTLNNPQLRRDVQEYFSQRLEDAPSMTDR